MSLPLWLSTSSGRNVTAHINSGANSGTGQTAGKASSAGLPLDDALNAGALGSNQESANSKDFQDLFSTILKDQSPSGSQSNRSIDIQAAQNLPAKVELATSSADSGFPALLKGSAKESTPLQLLSMFRDLSVGTDQAPSKSGTVSLTVNPKSFPSLKTSSEELKPQTTSEADSAIAPLQTLASVLMPSGENAPVQQAGPTFAGSKQAIVAPLISDTNAKSVSLSPIFFTPASSTKDSEALSFGLILHSVKPSELTGQESAAAVPATGDGEDIQASSPAGQTPPVSIASLLGLKSSGKKVLQNKVQDINPSPVLSKGDDKNSSAGKQSGSQTSLSGEALAEPIPVKAIHPSDSSQSVSYPATVPAASSVDPKPEPVATVAPSAPMPKLPEPASGPTKEFVVRLEGQSGEKISVRVADLAGQVQIAVRSSDPTTASALRQDLSTLTTTLEHAGWKSQVVLPTLTSGSNEPTAALPGAKSENADQQSEGRTADWSFFEDSSKKRSTISELWDDILTRQGTYS